MTRYVLALVVGAGLLGGALYLQQRGDEDGTREPEPAVAVLHGTPKVTVADHADGSKVHVKLRCAGSVSHAALAYRLDDGKRRTLKRLTACKKATVGDITDADGVSTSLEIEGVIPAGARDVEVLLVSETGQRVAKLAMP